MNSRQVWAVVVARTGPSAKSRLALALAPSERAALARRMLRHVLEACRGADLGGTLVVTEANEGAALAEEMGALVLPDPGAGLNGAVSLGLDVVAQQVPGSAALILPGDVPLVQSSDLRVMIHAALDHPRVVVLVPDAAGRGTNALLVRPPHLIQPSFGEPSYERHYRLARRAGIAIRLTLPNLAIDIDDEDRLSRFAPPTPSTHQTG